MYRFFGFTACLIVLVACGCKPPAGSSPAQPAQSGSLVPAAPVSDDGGAAAQPAPSPPQPPLASPPVVAAAQPEEPLPDDPLELARQALAAQQECIRLISSVTDIESAKTVADSYPQIDRRHRLLEEKLGRLLIPAAVQQQLDREFKPQQQELRQQWGHEFNRVAFIPGAWEHMHPELASYADMTVIPQDQAGLEQHATRLLAQAIELVRQVTDVNKALELSPRYRVVSNKIAPVLMKLNVANGGSGAREVQSPTIKALRKQHDEERRRLSSIAGANNALRYGERPVAGTAVAGPAGNASAIEQTVAELRSGDSTRVINALIRLDQVNPAQERAPVCAEALKLLAHERVRGTAVDSIKKGWFAPSQISQIIAAMPMLEDRGLRYQLAEGIAKTPNLDRETIQFLATLFDENPGQAVHVLRIVGPPAEPVIQAYAASSNVEIRKAVCEALRDIGSDASLPTLEKLTKDSDRGVADKAQEAIRGIGRPLEQRHHIREWKERQAKA